MPEELMRLWRSARGCCLVLAVLAVLLLLGVCIATGWGLAQLTHAAAEPGLDVMLVIDQSGSLWELGGVGSDPDLLRMEGARLFAATLGVDGSAAGYRLGAVYFGTQPMLAAPLTPLIGPGSDRQGLLARLSVDPQPLGWTDVSAALALAYQELYQSERAAPDRAKAVVLFTDGRPQTETLDTPAAAQAYLDELRRDIDAFTDQGAVFHTVLLGNAASDADPVTRDVYRPLWIELAAAGRGVFFHEARSSQDLAAIYHDIAAQLHRSNSQGMVVQQTVRESLETAVDVGDDWQTATFVIHKSAPDLAVTLMRPDGQILTADAPGVRYSGQLASRYETWSIDRPAAGPWQVQVAGNGAVAVWLDYQMAPAPPTATANPSRTATPTVTASPTASATPSPTNTATPSPTATATALAVPAPRLEIVQPQSGVSFALGQPATLVIHATHVQPESVRASLTGGDLVEPASIALTRTVDADDAGLIVWRGLTGPLETTGAYTVTVTGHSEVGRGVRLDVQQQVMFAAARRGAVWGWLAGAGLGLAAIGVVGGGLRRRSRRPLLVGVLRVTRSPAGQTVGQSWDLSAQTRRSVTLGSGRRCEVSLPNDPLAPAQAALIRSPVDAGSSPLLFDLTPQAAVRVNGQPVGKQHALADGDTIELGSYQLRYENLALRRQGSRPGEQVHRQNLQSRLSG